MILRRSCYFQKGRGGLFRPPLPLDDKTAAHRILGAEPPCFSACISQEHPILSFFFCLFRAAPTAHGGSQAKGGLIGAVATGLHHNSQQHRILNLLSEARDRTCNLIVPGWIHFHCATMGTLQVSYLNKSISCLSLCLSLNSLCAEA